MSLNSWIIWIVMYKNTAGESIYNKIEFFVLLKRIHSQNNSHKKMQYILSALCSGIIEVISVVFLYFKRKCFANLSSYEVYIYFYNTINISEKNQLSSKKNQLKPIYDRFRSCKEPVRNLR